MKTTSLLNHNVITGTVYAGAVLFLAAGASAQNLYESDYYTGAINEFNSSGTPTPFVSSTQPGGWQLAFNSSGDLFVGNNSSTTITEVTPNGHASSFGFNFSIPTGVAVDSAGNVFVANLGNGEIIKVSPDGSSESLFAAGLSDPYFLTFNSSGTLFESDWGSGNVYEFINGVQTLYASGFQHPVGLAFNTAGDLFVANALDNNQGYISEVTSTGTSTILSDLDNPQGLAINSAGDLFIALSGPGTGSIEELTSTGSETFSTQVSTPEGLAFAPVPEPSTLALLAVGVSAVVLRLRRKE
jgi:PEP-CTERM motif